jgi:hypothetical protein
MASSTIQRDGTSRADNDKARDLWPRAVLSKGYLLISELFPVVLHRRIAMRDGLGG